MTEYKTVEEWARTYAEQDESFGDSLMEEEDSFVISPSASLSSAEATPEQLFDMVGQKHGRRLLEVARDYGEEQAVKVARSYDQNLEVDGYSSDVSEIDVKNSLESLESDLEDLEEGEN